MKFNIEVKSDFELMKIPIKECYEKLVNLRDYSKEIIIDIEKESKRFQKLKTDECFVRESVAIMLSQAHSLLPNGLYIKIIDGFSPMSAQKRIYSLVFEELTQKNPKLSKKDLEVETDKYVANPKTIPPHTTGGAVDITLVNEYGKEIEIGSEINTLSQEGATDCPKISPASKKNRKLLIKIMRKVGFANYPLEWWHWSYGDRIWAFYENEKYAIYGKENKDFLD
mgnify:CR=1 FL=1